MLDACKGSHFCAVRWWSGFPRLQRSTTGANEELRHCAPGPSHCDYAALDQSAKELRAKLANSSRARRYFFAVGGHQIAAGGLQQRQLPLLGTGNGRIYYTLCFCPVGAECLTRPAARALRGVLREPVEQHVIRSHRCPAFDNQSDQRIYSCLSHAPGATAQKIVRPRFF